MKKLIVCFAFVALAIANAKSYSVTLSRDMTVGNTELKAGEYRLEVVGDKAILTKGKIQAEAPAKLESTAEEFRTTTLRVQEEGGKTRISEIRLAGTKTKVVFD
jgi:hypothetical protein